MQACGQPLQRGSRMAAAFLVKVSGTERRLDTPVF